MLIFCVYWVLVKPSYYCHDFHLYDTEAIASLEPKFLKDLKNELPEIEIPMYVSEDDNTIIVCGGWSERIVLSVEYFSKKELLDTVDKTIDSIRVNNLERHVHINIVLSKETSYQTFIDILDLFAKKNSMIYGLHKNEVFWIE